MRAPSLVLGLWMLATGSPARALEAVLLPSQPLEANGTRVHVLRLYLLDGDKLVPAREVRAAHGAVVGTAIPVEDGGLALRYRPPRVTAPSRDVLHVLAGGQDVPVEVVLKPPGRTQLQLEVTPDPLLLGKGTTAEVRLHARNPAGEPVRAPLRLGASVGRVSPLVEVAPGEYRATYTPPEERFPQVAILAALSIADGAFAAHALKLSARVPLDGEGEPGARMQVIVDGRTFGPEVIGPDGRFTIGLIVPPGGRATGVTTDRFGNERRHEIDLALPSFPRLVLAAVPNQLPADGHARAEVVAFAVDARGNPERNRAPQVVVERGSLSPPQARGDGVWSWTFTAPAEVGTNPILLHAGNAATRIWLKPAPPFHLTLVPLEEPLPAGSAQPVEVQVRVLDESESPVAGAELQATILGGRVLGVREVPEERGLYAIRLLPPRDPGRGATPLHVELGGVTPGAPRRVTLHPARATTGRIAAEAWVDDDLGLPVPGAPVELTAPDGSTRSLVSDRYGVVRLEVERPTERRFRVSARLEALPGLEATLDFVEAGGSLRAVPSIAGRGVSERIESPPGAALDAELPLRPAVPVDIRLIVEPRETRPGQPVRVRVVLTGTGKLAWQASGGTLELVSPLAAGAAELRFTPPADARPGAKYLISVTEEKTRVTAFTEVVVH
jgi:hypothetical protein